MEFMHLLLSETSASCEEPRVAPDLAHFIRAPSQKAAIRRRMDQFAYNFARRRRTERSHCVGQEDLADCEWEQLPDNSPTPLAQLLRQETNHQIFTALDTFTPEERELFLAYYKQSDTLTEIANSLGTSHQVVSQRLYRLRKRLKRRLEEMQFS